MASNEHNLVRCEHCKALFDKTLQWYWGQYEAPTSQEFIPQFKVEQGKCPICLKPVELS